MIINEKDVINIDEKKYVALATTTYYGVKYAFMNELDEQEEPTEKYLVFYTDANDELKALEDESIFERLIPIFRKTIKDSIEEVINN